MIDIYKWDEFKKILEDVGENLESPEYYISGVLDKVSKKFVKMFEYVPKDVSDKPSDNVIEDTRSVLHEMGLKLISCNISNSKTHKTLTIKLNDNSFMYVLMVTIQLDYVIDLMTSEEDFSEDTIELCKIKLKKYDDSSFILLGEMSDNNTKLSDINDDLFINLSEEISDINDTDDDLTIEYK